MKRRLIYVAVALLIAVSLLTLVPNRNVKAQKDSPPTVDKIFTHISQSAAISFWLKHPERAPQQLQQRLRAANQAAARARAAQASAGPARARLGVPKVKAANLFNLDTVGFPQNEESITACRPDLETVLGGTNDYRGLLDPEGNFTGWHFSTDGGESVANEGLLPSIEFDGKKIPSEGDPVMASTANCRFYAGSLNFDPTDPNLQPNGIGVYRSNAATLASCPGGSDASCWPTRRTVDIGGPDHFLDKPWLDVGRSGNAGLVVWVVYTDFFITGPGPLDFTDSIMAVRCDDSLNNCTSPILISGSDPGVQFGDVTIGPDGRTYITWVQILAEPEGPMTFVHKLRIASAGSTAFGPTRVVATEELPLPFGGFLHANDFRTATYPKNEVVEVGGSPRIFVVWDACKARLFDTVCEEPEIKLTFSDNNGETWSDQQILSTDNDNYFPTISSDSAGRIAVAWYTNRFDPNFHNRQDVELVTLNAPTSSVTHRTRISPISNETESDPLLGGFFIGDYFEVFAHQGTAYVHYNANYRQIEVLGEGFPINQQDNFLVRTRLLP